MFVLLTLLCVWLGVQVNQAVKQRQVVDWIRASGGEIEYQHEFEWASSDNPSQLSYEDYAPGANWLRDFFGEEYFFRIKKIEFKSPTVRLNDISMLAHSRHVKDLELRRTQVRDLTPLSHLSDLESLALVETHISDLSALRTLGNLQSLNICYAEKLEDISALANLSNLRHLRLLKTNVRDLSPLKELRNLETIRVQWTPVQDISPLMNLTQLKSLQLAGTDVNQDDLERLQAVLQNCKIRRN